MAYSPAHFLVSYTIGGRGGMAMATIGKTAIPEAEKQKPNWRRGTKKR